MKIKKIVGACVAVASIALMSVVAQAAVYSVEAVNAGGAKVDDEVTVKIYAEPNDGLATENINGFASKITYENAYLSPVSQGTDATGAACYAATDLTGVLVADKVGDTQIAIAWADSAPITVTEKTAVASVTFKVVSVDKDSTPISIEIVDAAESSSSKGEYSVSTDEGGVNFTVTVLLGDVNGDGSIGPADIAAIGEHILGITPIVSGTDAFIAGDVNKDNSVGAADIGIIGDYLLGKDTVLG